MASTLLQTVLLIFTLNLICWGSFALPLPRIVSSSAARGHSFFWELEPVPVAAKDYPVLLDFVEPSTYGYSRTLDPERSYIEMVLPSECRDAAKIEKKPSSKPKPAPTLIINPIQNITNNVVNCTNSTFVNCTDEFNNMTNETATVSYVGSQRTLNNIAISGAYELAFVTHQPTPNNDGLPLRNPYIQYADYALLPWRTWSEPLIQYGGLYQAVYVYKPVYPKINQKYDVYHYFLLPKGVTEGSEITMPDTQDDVQPSTNTTTFNSTTVMNWKMKERAEQDHYTASTTTKPNIQPAISHSQTQESALRIMTDNTKEVQSSDNNEVIFSQDVKSQGENTSKDINLEKELEGASDQDLLEAIENVLEELQDRLSD